MVVNGDGWRSLVDGLTGCKMSCEFIDDGRSCDGSEL